MRIAAALAAGVIIVLILVGTSYAITPRYNVTINKSEHQRTYNYMVNITVSKPHNATYINAFNRPRNMTLNVSRTPKEELGVKPALKKPNDTAYDRMQPIAPMRLDPRTCPNDIAYCYAVLGHEQNRTTFGKNYTSVSSYIMPEKRVRTFVCIGNDTACVASATNCFCPTIEVSPPPRLSVSARGCAETTNLCQSSYGTFSLCSGNISTCLGEYQSCGCGPAAACVAKTHTCVNTRDQLVMCKGMIADCIREYGTCFCGSEMSLFQQGCTTTRHECVRDNQTFTCYGTLSSCAIKYDRCDC